MKVEPTSTRVKPLYRRVRERMLMRLDVKMLYLPDATRSELAIFFHTLVYLSLMCLSLKALDDAGARKLEDLRRWDPATYDAVVWLRNNQNEFQKEILEPPCLCLNITDKRFTSPVEACFNSNQLRVCIFTYTFDRR